MAATRDLLIEQSLPVNLDAERFVLGAIMTDVSAFLQVGGKVAEEDFSLEKHRVIFRRICNLQDRGETIDRITLANELMKHGELQSIDGLSYLVSLDDGLPQIYSLDSYVNIVKEKSLLRRIITVSQGLINRCITGTEDAIQIIGAAEEALIGLGDVQSRTTLSNPAQIIDEFQGGINAFLDTSKRIKGIGTGFLKLDEMTGGLREGELVIVAARPAMGKTAFALNIAQHVATNQRSPKAVAVFSLEMSKESLLTRMLCAAARVDQSKFRNGFLNQEERTRLQEAAADIYNAPLYIDDTAGTNLIDVHAKLRRLQAEHELGLVVIDYLQLMQSPKRENRVQEVSALSRGLKLMSKDLRVPFLVLSQLSRASETRQGDHRPMLSDLRESGCLTGDTLIPIACNGKRIPIRELVGKKGFRVWALNEQTLKFEPGAVSAAFSTGEKRVFELRTRLGRVIRATANHPFRTFSAWKPLDQLQPGEFLAVPRMVPGSSTQTMSDSELSLLGHLIGDGCTLPRHVIQYTTKERELAEIVAALATEVFGDEISPRISAEHRWLQVYLTSNRVHTHGVHSPIADWLNHLGVFGLRSWEKRIPARVFEQPRASIAVFLRHLWATDGCIALRKAGTRYTPVLYYATSSENLARDLQSLLLRLEINSLIRRVSQETKGRNQFHVIITGAGDVGRAIDQIGALGERRIQAVQSIRDWMSAHPGNTNRDVIPREIWRSFAVPAMQKAGMTTRQMFGSIKTAYCGTKIYGQNISRERAERLGTAVRSEEILALAASNLYWDEITSITPAGTAEVFDLTVPGYHNFIAHDFVVHNSIEQDADMVMFIFREEVYRPDKESLKGIAEILMAKQRNGPTGRVKLAFLNKFTKFENLALDTGDEDGGAPFE